jgi:predicted small metal-binding protein
MGRLLEKNHDYETEKLYSTYTIMHCGYETAARANAVLDSIRVRHMQREHGFQMLPQVYIDSLLRRAVIHVSIALTVLTCAKKVWRCYCWFSKLIGQGAH